MNLAYLKSGLQSLMTLGLISVKENTNLSEYASFRIGGPADFVVHPKNSDALIKLIKLFEQTEYPFQVFGNATNILFSDAGYRGAAIFTTDMQSYTREGNMLSADAGMSFTLLSVKARDHALSGLEFAYGIPGTVGGAIFMNAGAYGGSVADHLISSICYDPTSRSIRMINGVTDHSFGYRRSCYMENKCVILSGTFALNTGDASVIANKMKELMDSRRAKQPLEYPNAGSVFKRPDGYFAGKLIEDCGLKGYSIGGAQVSEKHAGFIVNRGGATATDVKYLIEHIRNEVQSRFSVQLETEIISLNENGKAGI